MAILSGILTVFFVMTCVLMILIILLQPGKGEGLGAIAGMSNQTFGGAGPTSFLSKLTTGVAVAFMVLVIALAKISSINAEPPVAPAQETPTLEPSVNPEDIESAVTGDNAENAGNDDTTESSDE